jgi:hypothetical protein
MKFKHLILAAALFGVAFAAIVLPKSEYDRVSSPDGKLIVTAYKRAIYSFIPLSPGHGGDASGWIRVETKDGRIIHEFPVAMLSLIRDIRWENGAAHILGTN